MSLMLTGLLLVEIFQDATYHRCKPGGGIRPKALL
jgi:hypothetical protein